MLNYVLYTVASGRIVSVHSSNEPPDQSLLPAGQAALQVPDGTIVGFRTHQVAGPGTPAAALVPFVATFAENKATKIAAALDHFASLFRLPAGYSWSGALFQIDANSQAAITAMGADADRSLRDPTTFPWDPGFYFIAADNSHVAMTATQMASFSQAIANYVRQARYRVRAIKDAIAAAADRATLDAIDVTAGYPVSSS